MLLGYILVSTAKAEIKKACETCVDSQKLQGVLHEVEQHATWWSFKSLVCHSYVTDVIKHCTCSTAKSTTTDASKDTDAQDTKTQETVHADATAKHDHATESTTTERSSEAKADHTAE